MAFAQTDKVAQLLNQQFAKEQKMYPAGNNSEKPLLVEPFQIKNDTLSMAFSYHIKDREIQYRRDVHLKDIHSFEKDRNVLFIAKEDSVKETVITKDSNGQVLDRSVHHLQQFFLELRQDMNDEALQKKVIKAFGKAGYSITGDYWHH
jgi:hypothetical protein